MGFELVFHYYERGENGKYNTESPQKIDRKVGDLDDLEVDELASHIMAQLSRRDIMVFDVEIFELQRKKINFKETKGGFLIKNKKFSLDQAANMAVEIVDIADTTTQLPHNVLVKKDLPPNELATRSSNMGNVRFWMEFNPEIVDLHRLQQKGVNTFTIGKKYPIYDKQAGTQLGTYVFLTVDDKGIQRTISDTYFLPPQQGLVGEREVGGFSPTSRETNSNLLYQNQPLNDEMPDISQLRNQANSIPMPNLRR